MRGVMHCLCAACGKAEQTSGCVRGFTCDCTRNLLGIAETCQRCFRCRAHCQDEAGYVSTDDWYAMTTEEKVALANEGKALRAGLQRFGRIYR